MYFSILLSFSFLFVFTLAIKSYRVEALSSNKTTNASLLLQCDEDVSDLKKT